MANEMALVTISERAFSFDNTTRNRVLIRTIQRNIRMHAAIQQILRYCQTQIIVNRRLQKEKRVQDLFGLSFILKSQFLYKKSIFFMILILKDDLGLSRSSLNL